MLSMVPLSMTSFLLFGAALGLIWAGTVPLSSGLVADIFGERHMGFLFGVVYVGHQLGSFFGAWIGGRIVYMLGYAAAATKRSPGFFIQSLATFALLLGALGAILWRLAHG